MLLAVTTGPAFLARCTPRPRRMSGALHLQTAHLPLHTAHGRSDSAGLIYSRSRRSSLCEKRWTNRLTLICPYFSLLLAHQSGTTPPATLPTKMPAGTVVVRLRHVETHRPVVKRLGPARQALVAELAPAAPVVVMVKSVTGKFARLP